MTASVLKIAIEQLTVQTFFWDVQVVTVDLGA
jgi:hypothetical protein